MAWKLRYAPHLGIRSIDAPAFKETLGTIDPLAQIRHAATLGFAGIADNLAKTRPASVQEQIGAELKRTGLAMSSFVSAAGIETVTRWSDRAEGALGTLQRELADSIATAHRLGGGHIVVSSGRDLRLPIGFEIADLVANLRELVPLAQAAGVVLCLEHTSESRVPGRLLHRLCDAWNVVQAIGSPQLQLVFDTFHTQVTDGDLINNFRRVRGAVAVVQIADNPGRMEPGTGEINFVNFLRALLNDGYRGLVELEYFMSRPGAAGEQQALQALRAIDAAL